jgi:pimeloyl-ACP methyl ester carboxylesterase
MSHPFTGSPKFPFDTTLNLPRAKKHQDDVHKALAELPQPRKHYKWYYSTESASSDMSEPTQGMHNFLRGYFHLKSADWAGNNPHHLKSFTALELAKLPNYYIMPFNSSMREAIAADMATEDPVEVKTKSAPWLPDSELAVYVSEFTRNTFQGGLNWYRIATDPANMKDIELFAGKEIEVPSLYIAGKKDWGTYQEPGAVEKLKEICQLKAARFVEDAGHWVQQEQPEEVVKLIRAFLEQI